MKRAVPLIVCPEEGIFLKLLDHEDLFEIGNGVMIIKRKLEIPHQNIPFLADFHVFCLVNVVFVPLISEFLYGHIVVDYVGVFALEGFCIVIEFIVPYLETFLVGGAARCIKHVGCILFFRALFLNELVDHFCHFKDGFIYVKLL